MCYTDLIRCSCSNKIACPRCRGHVKGSNVALVRRMNGAKTRATLISVFKSLKQNEHLTAESCRFRTLSNVGAVSRNPEVQNKNHGKPLFWPIKRWYFWHMKPWILLVLKRANIGLVLYISFISWTDLHQESNSDRQSKRQARWPLDHYYHGHTISQVRELEFIFLYSLHSSICTNQRDNVIYKEDWYPIHG